MPTADARDKMSGGGAGWHIEEWPGAGKVSVPDRGAVVLPGNAPVVRRNFMTSVRL